MPATVIPPGSVVPAHHAVRRHAPPSTANRFGHLVGIAVNLVLLFVAHHLLEWGWPAFLTPAFADVLPVVTASFVVGIAFEAIYLVRDRGWIRSLGNAVTAAFGFAVALRTWQVFPFDFSGYARDWTGTTRLVLVVVMAATLLGLVVESVRLLTWPLRDHDDD